MVSSVTVFETEYGKGWKDSLKTTFTLQSEQGLTLFRLPHLRGDLGFPSQALVWSYHMWPLLCQAVKREKTAGWSSMERGGQDKDEAGGVGR